MLRRHLVGWLGIAVAFTALRPAVAQTPARASGDWSAVEQALGRKGTLQPGGIIKFGFPRGDMQVTVGGISIKPALALGAWVAFKRLGKAAMVMGDLVLAEDEVGPVMQKLQEGGVLQTALHNHLLGESPRVMYMHIGAHGEPLAIASAIHDAIAMTKTPLGAPVGAPTPAIDLDTVAIVRVLGVSGRVNGGVYQVSVPRAERILQGGVEVPPSMGVATAINFQPTGGGKAAVTGDFVLTAAEVNPTIRVLEKNGIIVTAIHSHMLDENPRLFFMHFWAEDDADKLARGLHEALNEKRLVKPSAARGRAP